MTLNIEIDGRTRTATVERLGTGSRFAVTVDGVEMVVDAEIVGEDTLSVLLPANGYASHTVGFADGPGHGEVQVHLRTGTFTAVINNRRHRRGAPVAAAGAQRIVAPMPGRVVRVLVQTGDEVAVRQPLVVVEAMKMENELSSAKAGRVTQIAVTPGTSVEAGRLLVVVE